MAERKKNPTITTPILSLKYPKLDKPDYGSKDYPKPDGEYSTLGVMEAEDRAVKKFLADLAPHYRNAMEEANEEFKKLKVETRKKLGGVKENDLFTTLYDPETEEPTGFIQIKAAMKASGVRKDKTTWKAKPDIYDAKGRPMKKVPEIWSGTKGILSLELQPYFIPGTGAAGLKLKLKAVQIIDLVSGGSRTASSHGFQSYDDGYEYEEPMDDEDNTTEDEDEGSLSKDLDDDIPF